jgi:hypothetical protein
MAKPVHELEAQLVGFDGVRRRLAVRADQTLVDLHYCLQEAFEWADDHLWTFWVGDEFWPREGVEYAHPMLREPSPLDAYREEPRTDRRSPEIRLDRLRLQKNPKLAYLFDIGDEWRVLLAPRRVSADDGGRYPRILERVGEAPPQYPDYETEAA